MAITLSTRFAGLIQCLLVIGIVIEIEMMIKLRFIPTNMEQSGGCGQGPLSMEYQNAFPLEGW